MDETNNPVPFSVSPEEFVNKLGEVLKMDLSLESWNERSAEYLPDIICRDNKSKTEVLVDIQPLKEKLIEPERLLNFARKRTSVTLVWVMREYDIHTSPRWKYFVKDRNRDSKFFLVTDQSDTSGAKPGACTLTLRDFYPDPEHPESEQSFWDQEENVGLSKEAMFRFYELCKNLKTKYGK